MASDENPQHSTDNHPTDKSKIYVNGVYEYRDSHIRERHGRVPRWLWVVTGGLIIWGIYYIEAYWNAPHLIIY